MAELTITRSFDASREAVFDAWTDPAKFAVWFGTDGVDVPAETLSMDVRPGGSWSAVMRLPDDTSINWAGEYLEVEQPAHLVMTITDNPADDARGVITVDLVEVAGATEMVMSQVSPGFDQGQADQTAIGYHAFFDVMQSLVSERE
jgi:uncharacterized protein YndB with AHSA1/START domain